MLQGDFFYITTLQTEDNIVKALLELNAKHLIFTGHFPGQPVVPGACMMQMVKEIAERVTGKEMRLVKADNMKFLAVIIPAENKMIQMELKLSARENGETGVDAQLLNNTTLFFKFKGLFV